MFENRTCKYIHPINHCIGHNIHFPRYAMLYVHNSDVKYHKNNSLFLQLQLSGLKNPDVTFRRDYKSRRTSAIICSLKVHIRVDRGELNEQLMLISQLDEDEKNALVKIINSMLTKKRMKDLLDGKVNF